MPLPKGYVLDSPAPQSKLPAGYTLDQPSDAPAAPMQAGTQPTGATPNAFQNFASGLQSYIERPDPTDNGFQRQAKKFVGGVVQGSLGVAAHPIAAAKSFADQVTPKSPLESLAGPALPAARMLYGTAKSLYQQPAATAGNLVGGIALGEGLGETASAALNGVKPLARAAAIGDTTRMIRPNATDVAFGKSPAQGLLDQPGGTMAMSKEGLLARSRANLQTAGQNISGAIKAAPQTPMNVSGAVRNPFLNALSDAAKSNQTGLFGRLQETQKGLTRSLLYDPASESILDQGPANLSSMTPSDVFDLKKRVGDNTKWTNQAFDNDVNATQGSVYGGLKDALNNQIPALRPLNQNYGNLRAGISALDRRIPIEARANAISLPDAIMGAGGTAAGGPVTGLATIAAKKLFSSTPVRTGIQTGLYRVGSLPRVQLRTPSVFGGTVAARSQR